MSLLIKSHELTLPSIFDLKVNVHVWKNFLWIFHVFVKVYYLFYDFNLFLTGLDIYVILSTIGMEWIVNSVF